ncbi:MAG TPA: AMP-binding protein [Actinomycetota bacterium]
MIGRLRSDLRQGLEIVRPATLQTFWRAGTFDLHGAVGLAASWPWLLGRGASLGIVSQLNRIALPDKTAIIDRQGELTWSELDRRANRLVHAFARLGLRGGDRVALLLRNGRELVECMLAAQKAGIVAAPLNTWAKPKELAATLDQAGPKALVYDVLHADQVRKTGVDGPALVAVGDVSKAVEDSAPYEELLASRTDAPLLPLTLRRGSPKVIIHTSGTTGTPKGAARDAAVTGVREFAGLLRVVPLRRDDVILCPAPLFHSFGLLALVAGTLIGATFVLPEKFDPEQALELIEEHAVTAAAMVPIMIRRIVSLPEGTRHRRDLSSLRILLASGAAIPEDVRTAVADTFGEVLYDLYGSTEAGWVAIATPEDMRRKQGTLGRPVQGVEVAVFSPEGDPLQPGEVGEIHVKSSARFEGYTTGEDKPQRDGYMSIGDLGHLDEEGYLFVEGRADDMVVVGGENVYPAEIEDVIRGVEGVREVAVAGAKDPDYGQVLMAFVVGSADPEEILRACRDQLASFKVPRRVEVVDELPRTATGKVLKRELVGRPRDRDQ